jgi:hypothetical protein
LSEIPTEQLLLENLQLANLVRLNVSTPIALVFPDTPRSQPHALAQILPPKKLLSIAFDIDRSGAMTFNQIAVVAIH